MPYYRSSESSYPPSADYEHEKFDEYRRLQQRVSYRNKKFKDEVKWHPFWTQEELLARQREHDAYIKRYVAEQEKIIEQKLEPLKRAQEKYRQHNMHDSTYPHAREGLAAKSSEYFHQAYLENRRLDGRIRYRNTKFKVEVASHPEWSRQELRERICEHEAFISDYTEKERQGINYRMMEFEEDERRRAKEETRKRAEEEYHRQQKASGEEGRRQEWHQQQQQQEGTKRRDENAYGRQQWWYNHFEEEKRRYESQKSRREEHAKRDAQEREEKQRQRAFEEDRQRREKEPRERRRKQAEESERLKEQRYKSYEDGWSPRAPWKTKTNILFNDIPWPTLYHPQSADAITSEVVTAFFGDPKYFASEHWISRKRRIHTELLRWHSDKFHAVLKNVAYSDQLVVHAAAEVVVRALNELKG